MEINPFAVVPWALTRKATLQAITPRHGVYVMLTLAHPCSLLPDGRLARPSTPLLGSGVCYAIVRWNWQHSVCWTDYRPGLIDVRSQYWCWPGTNSDRNCSENCKRPMHGTFCCVPS